MDYESKLPLSRCQIREIANFTRKLLKIRTIKFPVIKALDNLVEKFPNNLYYSILQDREFEKNVMAELLLEQADSYCIKIRESVYEKALKNNRACLGFICHELCHFILIHIFDAGPKLLMRDGNLVYARHINSNELPAYKSVEWQAKALCGEIMIPYEKCKNFSKKQIIKKTFSSDDQTQYFLDYVIKAKENCTS